MYCSVNIEQNDSKAATKRHSVHGVQTNQLYRMNKHLNTIQFAYLKRVILFLSTPLNGLLAHHEAEWMYMQTTRECHNFNVYLPAVSIEMWVRSFCCVSWRRKAKYDGCSTDRRSTLFPYCGHWSTVFRCIISFLAASFAQKYKSILCYETSITKLTITKRVTHSYGDRWPAGTQGWGNTGSRCRGGEGIGGASCPLTARVVGVWFHRAAVRQEVKVAAPVVMKQVGWNATSVSKEMK